VYLQQLSDKLGSSSSSSRSLRVRLKNFHLFLIVLCCYWYDGTFSLGFDRCRYAHVLHLCSFGLLQLTIGERDQLRLTPRPIIFFLPSLISIWGFSLMGQNYNNTTLFSCLCVWCSCTHLLLSCLFLPLCLFSGTILWVSLPSWNLWFSLEPLGAGEEFSSLSSFFLRGFQKGVSGSRFRNFLKTLSFLEVFETRTR